MTDPRLLRPFVALADELHFGRAAERLHVTQPALSQQIARLERQLGVRLFDRTRTRVELTEAGAAMLPAARTAVEAAAAAAEVARSHAHGEAGELRLGLSPGAHYVAQPLLAEFARRRPRVRVRARQDSSGALAEQVADGRLELALGFCTEPRDGVVCAWLRDEPVVVAVGAGHPLAEAAAWHSPSWPARPSRSSTNGTAPGTTGPSSRSAGRPASSPAHAPSRTGRWRGRRPCAVSAASG